MEKVKKHLLWIVPIMGFLIATAHFLATKYFWYWTFDSTDLIMHGFTGYWAFLTLILFSIIWFKKIKLETVLLSAIALTVLIGIFWEIFEYTFHLVEFSSKYPMDTLTDLIMDTIGGSLAWYTFEMFVNKDKKACLQK